MPQGVQWRNGKGGNNFDGSSRWHLVCKCYSWETPPITVFFLHTELYKLYQLSPTFRLSIGYPLR